MTDRYSQITRLPLAGQLVKTLGLPQPQPLDRFQPGRPAIDGPVLLGAAPGGRLASAVAKVLAAIGAEVHTIFEGEARTAAADAGLDAGIFNPDNAPPEQRFKALVFDASGIASTEDLPALHAFFSPTIRRVVPSGRVIVLGAPPDAAKSPREHAAQRALEGFTRAVGKEVKRGATAQLVYVAKGGDAVIESTLRFLLSPKSAYVSGQVIRIARAPLAHGIDWERPLAGRVAVVTGSSRGIGAAIADVLARDGAKVVGVDVPQIAEGATLPIDITDPEAPRELADHLEREHGGVDIVVHNAGITRDKTLARMSADLFAKTIDVNVSSTERINEQLLERDLLREHGRIVGVSSISGIAGNAGQTNYATSKAAVIGVVEALAPVLAKRTATINAVAPGFIETQMTAEMPIALREAGRRMNSLSQGGLPVDVAETIAWYANPGSGGVNGNVVRVCGQSLIGA
jgi:3-oxoacyl-[acyl-carrier protein] reductase